MRAMLLLLLAMACGGTTPASAAGGADKAASPAGKALYDLKLTSLDGAPYDARQLEGKAVLFVNVASKCGYTPQYEGLQALYERYRDRGLVIVGTPCNQFMGQEPGTAEEIVTFCKMNYGVTFPLLEKQDVNGAGRSPLYRFLVDSEVGGGEKIGWNFTKFLVDPKGEVVGRWASKVTPESEELVAAIEKVLPTP